MSAHLYFCVAVFFWQMFLTDGEVWPKPQSEQKGKDIFSLDPAIFKVKVMDENCTLLWKAIKRYKQVIKGHEAFDDRDLAYLNKTMQSYSPLQELRIYLSTPCDFYPPIEMDEKYCLSVSKVSELRAKSVWGILRGLETFAQLFELASSGYKVKRVRATRIVDFPRYAHRGFLVDTARHYLSADTLLTQLEAMAANKLNVLHWHIVDSDSFPFHSDKLPELSEMGAFDTYRVYDKRAIRKIVDFAAERGIRVIPEIDMPGHTNSWGRSHPEVMLQHCRYPGGGGAGGGVLNPARDATYHLVGQLIGELQLLFPDQCLHLGGDEVSYECWKSDDEVRSYMELHDLTAHALLGRFVDRVSRLLSDRVPIYWEDVYIAKVNLSNNSIVQIWKDFRSAQQTVELMSKIMHAGLRVVYSRGWFLDRGSQTSLQSAYRTDPRSIYYTSSTGFAPADALDKIVGGEACLWADDVDDLNFHSISWPRGAAVAEVLWSPRDLAQVPRVPLQRLREHMKRMHDRGLPVKESV